MKLPTVDLVAAVFLPLFYSRCPVINVLFSR